MNNSLTDVKSVFYLSYSIFKITSEISHITPLIINQLHFYSPIKIKIQIYSTKNYNFGLYAGLKWVKILIWMY